MSLIAGSPAEPDGTGPAVATATSDADAECVGIVSALQQAHALIAEPASPSVDPLSLLGQVKHSSITALQAVSDLSDGTLFGSIPAFRYATAWARVARRELEQQLHNAQQPGAIVLTGQLALALVKASDLIEWTRRSLADGCEPYDGSPW